MQPCELCRYYALLPKLGLQQFAYEAALKEEAIFRLPRQMCAEESLAPVARRFEGRQSVSVIARRLAVSERTLGNWVRAIRSMN
ncbi:transposase [Mycetohabitans sp. B4]|nr:transposase [Mycetohabitans sp. B4]